MEGVRNVTHHQSRSPHVPCTSGFGCLGEGSKAFRAGIGSAEAQPPPEKQLCFWMGPRVQSSTNTEGLPDLAPPPSQLLTLNICTLLLSVDSITTARDSAKKPPRLFGLVENRDWGTFLSLKLLYWESLQRQSRHTLALSVFHGINRFDSWEFLARAANKLALFWRGLK